MAVSTVQKFLDRLAHNKNVLGVVAEFNKLGDELKKRGHILNLQLTKEGEKTLHQAHAKVREVLKTVADAQKQLDREVEFAVAKIRRSAAGLEKSLEMYRKRAIAQKKRLEKLIAARSKKAKTVKKATSRRTKSSARKAPARTTKKTSRTTV